MFFEFFSPLFFVLFLSEFYFFEFNFNSNLISIFFFFLIQMFLILFCPDFLKFFSFCPFFVNIVQFCGHFPIFVHIVQIARAVILNLSILFRFIFSLEFPCFRPEET